MKAMSNKKLNDFGYARMNGFSGGIYEYLQGQYRGYVETCTRCEITPMTYLEWIESDE